MLRYGFGMEQPKGNADGRAEYPANLARQPRPLAFKLAIEALLPIATEYEGRRKTLKAWLGSRATWPAIKHWKADRVRAPKWVRQVMAQKAKEKAAALLHVAALLEDEKR